MSTKQKIRPVGDKTRLKIIKAAQKLFAKQGFSATPIAQIAQKAKINQSLIFHHFGNKEGLWKTVKKQFLLEDSESYDDLQLISYLPDFIDYVVATRSQRFEKFPDMVRILQWQNLEPKAKQLIGGNKAAPDQWLQAINRLQVVGQITTDYPAEHIMVMLASVIDTAYLSQIPQLSTLEKKQHYLGTVKQSLMKLLS